MVPSRLARRMPSGQCETLFPSSLAVPKKETDRIKLHNRFLAHCAPDILVAAGNVLLRIAGCCYRRDKTELSHHADVIAGRVVIGDFAVSELQPVNMIGLKVFSGRRNAH
jgi:hypothetical protein